MLGEREKVFPKTPLINIDQKGFDLVIIVFYSGFIFLKSKMILQSENFM